MIRLRKRILSMMLAMSLCSAAFPAGGMTAFAQEPAQAGQMEEQEETCLWEESLASGKGSLDAAWEGTRGETLRDGDYMYRVLEDNTVEIFSYHGTEKNVKIPSQIAGKDVTALGWSSFSDKDIERVEIPSSVTEIGHYAFSSCKN